MPLKLAKRTHLDKVLAHAERELAGSTRKASARLDLYKRFIKLENHRLKIEHSAGESGLVIASRRAQLLDVVIRHLLDHSAASVVAAGGKYGGDLAILATGGYGRGELNPHSDIDIMFLQPGNVNKLPAATSEVIEQMLYLLWDVGFKVGHATRSISNAISHANEDMLTKTSLLETRLIAGDKTLFEKFRKTFADKCVRGKEEPYIRWRVQNQAERHKKQGGTVYLQEPNIKNGCGGLRDYQNLTWITYFKEGDVSLARLVERKFLTESERRTLNRAYDFLLRVRTELHYQYKRPTDTLTIYYQGQIATTFEYPQRSIIRRNEAFMRDYYRHTRDMMFITTTVADRLSLPSNEDEEPQKSTVFGFLARRPPKREEFDGFYSLKGCIYSGPKDPFKEDHYRLMRVFQHAQVRELALSPQLRQLIHRRSTLVTRTYQYSSAARQTFEAMLSRKGQVGRVMRMMHETDVLGRYIPEFGELTCLVQHEFFHRYTADEHTLLCLEKLDSVIDTSDERLMGYRELFQRLENPYVLYLAILLHDSGKASGARNHAEASAVNAQRVANRLQLSAAQRKALILLVDNHLVISDTAQRRNLEDPATIDEFAGIVKDVPTLNALMLLTLADGMATVGEQTWSDWKESLVWQLYRNTTSYLEDHEGYTRARQSRKEELQQGVVEKMSSSYVPEIDVHFESMPDHYFAAYEPAEIAGHVRLFHSFFSNTQALDPVKSLRPATKWIAQKAGGHSEVLVCTWDREGLLARIAACFASAQLNILAADIYTRSDNLVLDVFRVCTTDFQAVSDEKQVKAFEEALEKSTTSVGFDFTALLEKARKKIGYHLQTEIDFPTKVNVRNDVHPSYTLVDLQTPDRLGLLYELMKAFAACRVNVAYSRITTEKGGALDSFYVTDRLQRKIIKHTEISELQRALQKAATGKAVTRVKSD